MEILINNLTKNYGGLRIISNLCVELDHNNIYFLTSENGKGKTTFFKCLLRKTKYFGQIIDNGLVYAYLPEKVNFPFLVRLKEFIKMYLELDDIVDFEAKIEEYLMLFGIIQYQNKYIHQLSKGTKQKALIIKTLLSNADVFLLDEPLSGLDNKSRIVFMSLIKELQTKEKIIIIASHFYNEYSFENKKEILFE